MVSALRVAAIHGTMSTSKHITQATFAALYRRGLVVDNPHLGMENARAYRYVQATAAGWDILRELVGSDFLAGYLADYEGAAWAEQVKRESPDGTAVTYRSQRWELDEQGGALVGYLNLRHQVGERTVRAMVHGREVELASAR
jgi:hypothetical protein